MKDYLTRNKRNKNSTNKNKISDRLVNVSEYTISRLFMQALIYGDSVNDRVESKLASRIVVS